MKEFKRQLSATWEFWEGKTLPVEYNVPYRFARRGAGPLGIRGANWMTDTAEAKKAELYDLTQGMSATMLRIHELEDKLRDSYDKLREDAKRKEALELALLDYETQRMREIEGGYDPSEMEKHIKAAHLRETAKL